jgi:colicin import membrane protein
VAHNNPEDCWRIGFYSSIAGHIAIVVVSLFGLFGGLGELPEPVIYSVTVEPGKNLGGKSQLAKDDKPSPISPVKNVKADSSPQEEVKDKPVEEKPVDDAEVSIGEKKPTPKATPKATPKVTPKATPKATPASTSKADSKTKDKSSGDEADKRLQAAMQRYLGDSTDAGGKGFGAGRVGGQGMGGGEIRPPEFFKYRDLLLGRIKESWRWYDTNSSHITQIAFEMQPDGAAKNVRVVKSSGDSNFDESVIRAVIKASPFPPPPVSVYEKYFKSVTTTFDPRE